MGHTRRAILAAGGAMLASSLLGCSRSATSAPVLSNRLREVPLGSGATLSAAEHPLMLGDSAAATPTWLYGDTPFPVLRARAGEEMRADLVNNLQEHTSIHWHGVRVPNAMDGVPYMTQ